ncbi:hypothetical protein D3C81_1409060 [compost metagenome]
MVRVGLGQHLRIGPVVALVERPDPAEQLFVRNGAFEHLDDLAALVIARAFDIGAGGGDDEHQWLATSAHAGQHRVVLGRGRVFVVFVDDRAAG